MESYFDEEDWDIHSKEPQRLFVKPDHTGVSRLVPSSGAFGVNKGVGGCYTFEVREGGKRVTTFKVKISCPASGTTKCDVLDRGPLRVTYNLPGKDDKGFHIMQVTLKSSGPNQHVGRARDSNPIASALDMIAYPDDAVDMMKEAAKEVLDDAPKKAATDSVDAVFARSPLLRCMNIVCCGLLWSSKRGADDVSRIAR